MVDNTVYAFGGISGRGAGAENHIPMISNIIAEKYDVNSDAWEEIAIEGAIPVAAFGWTQLD